MMIATARGAANTGHGGALELPLVASSGTTTPIAITPKSRYGRTLFWKKVLREEMRFPVSILLPLWYSRQMLAEAVFLPAVILRGGDPRSAARGASRESQGHHQSRAGGGCASPRGGTRRRLPDVARARIAPRRARRRARALRAERDAVRGPQATRRRQCAHRGGPLPLHVLRHGLDDSHPRPARGEGAAAARTLPGGSACRVPARRAGRPRPTAPPARRRQPGAGRSPGRFRGCRAGESQALSRTHDRKRKTLGGPSPLTNGQSMITRTSPVFTALLGAA